MRDRLVTIADLAWPGRWIYTRQGIAKLARTADFPEPIAIVSCGRLKIWRLAHIVDYERRHPEVTSAEQKRRKMLGLRVKLPSSKSSPDLTRPWPWSLIDRD